MWALKFVVGCRDAVKLVVVGLKVCGVGYGRGPKYEK